MAHTNEEIEWVDDSQVPDEIPPYVNGCVHHWLVEPPEGRTSTGICSMCGAVREFSNSFDGTYVLEGDLGREI